MEIKIYDTNKKQFIWIKVSKEVHGQILKYKNKYLVDSEIKSLKKVRMRKFINSNDYKKFISELQPNIKDVFCNLSNMEKKTMFLRFYKEMSLGGIAEELDCAKGSVQSYLLRAFKKMKNYLDEGFESKC